MIRAITKRWSFATAQTDFLLEAVGASQRMCVTYAKAICGHSNTGDVSVELGFGTSTLPAVSNDSGTGGEGVFLSSAGIAPGGGEVSSKELAPFRGDADEDLRITCSAATGGALRIIVVYWLDELAETPA